jgi:ABC-type nitrate/sulfonate/bicarbonate transport system permease component
MPMRTAWLRPAASGLIRYALAISLFVVVWHLASVWVGKPNTLPRPAEVLVQAVDLIGTGELFGHVAHTLRRLLAGFALACAVGVPLGLALGLSRTLADYVTPVVEALRPISGIAWIPLALYALGVGEALPHFIIFYGAVFPILVNAAGAVRQVDPGLVHAARTLGASQSRVLLSIILPACLPMIFVGARLGLGVGWMAVIASELVGAPSGLGYMIEWNRTMLMSSRVLVGVLTIGFLGYLMDWGLRRAARALTPWWMGWRQQHA